MTLSSKGIERTHAAIRNADMVFWLIDGSHDHPDTRDPILNHIPADKPQIILFNKLTCWMRIQELRVKKIPSESIYLPKLAQALSYYAEKYWKSLAGNSNPAGEGGLWPGNVTWKH